MMPHERTFEKPYNDTLPAVSNNLLMAKYSIKKSNTDYEVKITKTPLINRQHAPSEGAFSREKHSIG